jgi:hypothetical protein
MTITLTREEAQQVLDAFESATPKYTRARKDGKSLGGELDYWKLEQHKRMPAIETLRARLSAPEPEPMRLRRGDTLRCIETNELCTVWATSTTGKTQVKWKANDFGSYTAEQIGDLFWVEPKPEPEPVACIVKDCENHKHQGRFVGDLCSPCHAFITRNEGKYSQAYRNAQREWQGLTDEEIEAGFITNTCCDDLVVYEHIASAIEAKLKEKNT